MTLGLDLSPSEAKLERAIPQPEEPRFGIIVGDIMHNLRSALDYIVTALVNQSRTRLTTSHQFPIYLDSTKFARTVGVARTRSTVAR